MENRFFMILHFAILICTPRVLDSCRGERYRRRMAPQPILEAVVNAVNDYTLGEQSDGITLVVARCNSKVDLRGRGEDS